MSRLVRVLVFATLFSVVAGVAVADDTEDLRSQLEDTQQLQERRASELEEVRQQAGTARERLERAEQALETAQDELAQRREDLRAARAELAEARELAEQAREELREVRKRLAETEAELDLKQIQLDNRVRAAFKYGQVSFAEAFVGTRDMSDFLNSTTYVGHVMANDRDLVEAVVGLLGQVEAQRAEAQVARTTSEREAQRAAAAATEVEQATRDQRRLTDQVAQRRVAHAEALEELQQDAAAISEHLDDLGQSEDRVRSQIAEAERRAEERLAEERRRQQEAAAEAERAAERARQERERQAAESAPSPGTDSPSSGGGTTSPAPAPQPSPPPVSNNGWLRPTGGHVSSGYGYRTHPVHGGQRLHAGVDLASPSGTPIRASRDGIVSFVGWMNGYGNTVMVSHGEGMVTLYAHLSSYAVSRDAYVAQGQTVGGVGMTGTATGPHLHFEVRVNGNPQNPCIYISC